MLPLCTCHWCQDIVNICNGRVRNPLAPSYNFALNNHLHTHHHVPEMMRGNPGWNGYINPFAQNPPPPEPAEMMPRNPPGLNGFINPFAQNPPPPERRWSLFSPDVVPGQHLNPAEQVRPLQRFRFNPVPPAHVPRPVYVSPREIVDMTEDDDMGQNPRPGPSSMPAIASGQGNAGPPRNPTNTLKRKNNKDQSDRTNEVKRYRREQHQVREVEPPREIVWGGPHVMHLPPPPSGQIPRVPFNVPTNRRVASSTVTSTTTGAPSVFHPPK